jgi:hypothetical protein
MNTFYIFVYSEIFKPHPGEFIEFLTTNKDVVRHQFPFFIVKQPLKTFNIENIILYSHLCKSVNDLPHDDFIPCRQKYTVLNSIFYNGCFDETCIEKVVDLYCTIQRRYLALNRFAYLWKLKRATTCVDTDLYLNPIETAKKNTFVLFQNNKKYCFVMTDLIKLLEIALCHKWEDDFEIISKTPCNPYNKQPLLRHDLYNIYFHMRSKMEMVIPSFMHLWFLESFDLASFPIKHNRMLRKMCIRNHVFNITNKSNLIYKDIREMIFENSYTRKWAIHADFPKETLVDVMRPYLYIYYLIHYDVLENEEQMWYEAALTLELIKCYKYNPSFGRKMVKPRSVLFCNKRTNPYGKVQQQQQQKEYPLMFKMDEFVTTEKYYFNADTIQFSSKSY